MKFATIDAKKLKGLQLKQPAKKANPEIEKQLQALKDAPTQMLLVSAEGKSIAGVRATLKKYATRIGLSIEMQTTVEDDAVVVKVSDKPLVSKAKNGTKAAVAPAADEDEDEDGEDEDE